MHNSDDSEKQTAAVRLYMDESGTLDPGTPTAVVGGVIINKSHYEHFEPTWDDILFRHNIEPPLHMKEFGRHGRLGWLTEQQRKELFAEVVPLINSHKISSLAATLDNSEYEQHLPKELRDNYSVYAMCFTLAVMINHKLADGRYSGRIPFILDTGNPYADHVRQAHASIIEFQKSESFLHAGGLHFDDDRLFGVLQAADVIAWGVRRKAASGKYPPGLEQIADLLIPEQGHNENPWKAEWLQMIGGWAKDALAKVKKREELDAEEF